MALVGDFGSKNLIEFHRVFYPFVIIQEIFISAQKLGLRRSKQVLKHQNHNINVIFP